MHKKTGIIDSSNDLSPGKHQAFMGTNDGFEMGARE